MMKKELRAVMAKYGDTYQTLAEALGITLPALSHKVNGQRPFKQKEISIMIDRYELSGDDAIRIFFT